MDSGQDGGHNIACAVAAAGALNPVTLKTAEQCSTRRNTDEVVVSLMAGVLSAERERERMES